MKEDVRWVQRLQNFSKVLAQLERFIEKKELNGLERQGIIQAFEYNFELSWNTLKDYFEYQGESNIHGSRDAIRITFQRGMIENGELWMQMLKSRTLTTHTYNETIAIMIEKEIRESYFKAFQNLQQKLKELQEK
jgi:nucleotidyltransferase substrate binding protein (TIGR01987 family)